MQQILHIIIMVCIFSAVSSSESAESLSPMTQAILEDPDLILADKLMQNMTDKEKGIYEKLAKVVTDRKTSIDEKLASIDEISGHNKELAENRELLKDILESYKVVLDHVYDELYKKISPRVESLS
ncbi:hypothetical protein WR25_14236 isoform B [Diploscapter pachys]|uniref:SXP/RAL-2 family protein Ani s 5-like cation-binding domain-containing protein n=1 Tax=Diploscapter pachys TaxID=2018661 RepID=A0A2A2KC76_9BILA|nr:hypothetical protein WR25_14236 isoform B [Diploscapter pachys]